VGSRGGGLEERAGARPGVGRAAGLPLAGEHRGVLEVVGQARLARRLGGQDAGAGRAEIDRDGPLSEKPASPSVGVVAATQSRLGASTLQGVCGVSASLSVPSLPAATTYSVLGCAATASATARETPWPLIETLATCAPMLPA